MRDLVAWMLGFGLAANGLIMLGFPADWYARGARRCGQTDRSTHISSATSAPLISSPERRSCGSH